MCGYHRPLSFQAEAKGPPFYEKTQYLGEELCQTLLLMVNHIQ